MTQFAISLGVFRVNRSCKPANPAFTMSEILRRARPRKIREGCASKLLLLSVVRTCRVKTRMACCAAARGRRPAFARWATAWSPSSLSRAKASGADRDRTDDLKLAKLPLSQLSYGPDCGIRIRWWARNELNVRPHAYQACALTT